MSYKIIHHYEKCIGCGSCVAICPENWQMNEEGKASPIKIEIEELGCNQEAERGCPVQCIHIKES
jgi:ferredoxin